MVLRGHNRVTQDIDALVLADLPEMQVLVDELSKVGITARVPDWKAFMLANRMLLLRTSSHIDIDISWGILPFEVDMVAGAERMIDGLLPVPKTEDILVMKLVAGRSKDLDDVRALVELGAEFDKTKVSSIVREMADALEDPQILVNLKLLDG